VVNESLFPKKKEAELHLIPSFSSSSCWCVMNFSVSSNPFLLLYSGSSSPITLFITQSKFIPHPVILFFSLNHLNPKFLTQSIEIINPSLFFISLSIVLLNRLNSKTLTLHFPRYSTLLTNSLKS
jgi:hypothetical protein